MPKLKCWKMKTHPNPDIITFTKDFETKTEVLSVHKISSRYPALDGLWEVYVDEIEPYKSGKYHIKSQLKTKEEAIAVAQKYMKYHDRC